MPAIQRRVRPPMTPPTIVPTGALESPPSLLGCEVLATRLAVSAAELVDTVVVDVDITSTVLDAPSVEDDAAAGRLTVSPNPYDASVVTTNAFQVYDIAIVTPEFFAGGVYDMEGNMTLAHNQRHEVRLARLQSLGSNGQLWNDSRWTPIPLTECCSQSDQHLRPDGGSILAVENPEEAEGHQRSVVSLHFLSEPFNWNYSYSWSPSPYIGCFGNVESSTACFSLKVPGRCRLQIHVWFILTTAILNATKLVCLLWTFREK
ncbi:hypothetical protein P171DRAFT_487786 [Karstenula rhodostoma CBS 690.94]|uniref:Uncharacterized protein n=1 Tax=Karstenula rhodostoma CBS 690.94 TaxID=1392251 RepID=A0A9P4PGM9_9PLEO|nr:hypothetical protein P171DRAFT_487786 [Karstenula rhodostoma CBS 690.94]